VTPEQANVIEDLWDHAYAVEGKIEDLVKRFKQAASALAEHNEGHWKEGAKALKVMADASKVALKGTKKMQDVSKGIQKKAAKTQIADVVSDLKKADKLIDPFDAAAGAFIIWHRKASKAIGLEMGHMDVHIVSMLKYVPMYLKYREVLNKELQGINKLARV
jgi:hypothetical protein